MVLAAVNAGRDGHGDFLLLLYGTCAFACFAGLVDDFPVPPHFVHSDVV
jgi:hypothetical protein